MTTTPATALTPAQIVAAFEKPLQPVRMSPFYRLGLALVALMMVLLPLVYLGLIGLVGYFLYYHATVNTEIFEGKGKATGRALVYFGPLLVGGILILFMIKPLFARRVASSKPVSVAARDEPVLFELVRKLCEVVGAPMPRRIDVDCQVNASASFRRGMVSFFGHDLLLTLGLPLVAGMRLRNLVGILAHEFGHFAQGTGMRLTYVIRAINIWFARVVYERDAWDARIEQWSKEIDIRIGIILYLARFFIWLTRRVLWALMMLGHAVSMFMLRQMEYDADQYEIQVSGSKTFKESTRGMAELNLAHQAAISALQESWNERRLGDDLPALIAAQREMIPADVREKFVGEWLGRKGSLLDTHPPDTRRVEAALRANAPGVFTLDVPATALFRQFDALARKATYAHYREVLGDEVSEKNLVPMSEFLRQQTAIRSDQEALDRFFQGYFNGKTPPFVPEEAALPPDDPQAAAAELRAVREELARALPRARATFDSLEEQDKRLRLLSQLELVVKAKLKFKPGDFNVQGAGREHIEMARKPVVARASDLSRELGPVNEGLVKRLTLDLRLAQAPEIAPKVAPPADQPDPVLLLSALSSLRDAFPEFRQLVDSYIAAGLILGSIEGNEQNEALVTEIRLAVQRWQRMLAGLHARLSPAAYPFRHAEGEISLARYVIGKVPGAEDIGAVIGTVEGAVDKFYGLYGRIMGQLISLAERVEAALELPPLPAPSR